MVKRNMVDIKIGSVWREADGRHTRDVKVLGINNDIITIITIFDSWKSSREWRPTKAKRSRFKNGIRTSHCGYYQITESDEKIDKGVI
jgi:hypothetical protein